MIKTIQLSHQLPGSIKAYSMVDPEDNYYIFINETLNEAARTCALQHELHHIKRGDFYGARPVREIEQ